MSSRRGIRRDSTLAEWFLSLLKERERRQVWRTRDEASNGSVQGRRDALHCGASPRPLGQRPGTFEAFGVRLARYR